jgi:hypothetical protein
MKTSHYKTTQQFIDRYYIGIDTSVISPDIDNLIKEYTISQISNKQKIIQNFLKYKIVGWVEKIKLSKQNKIGSLSYFQTLYGSVIGQVLFDESNRKRKTRKKETHFKSVEHLLSQKCMMVLGGKFSKNIINNLGILIKSHDKKFLINNKYCMLKTLIENDVSEVSWDILFERSKHLKNDACSLDGLILKYGEVCGKRLFAERGILVAVTKESYTKNHTEQDWIELCEKKKSNLGESGYIEKYGDVEGKKKWEEYLVKWKTGIQRRKNSGIWKNGLTLEEFQNKWGIEEGHRRWKKRIDDRKKTLSLVGYIEKYGKIDGVLKWDMLCKSNNKTSYESFVTRYGEEEGRTRYIRMAEKILKYQKESITYSKISQELFNQIEKYLDNKSMIKYALNGGEQYFFINEEFCKGTSVDFKYGNAIIEFYGDYWHGNPLYYSEEELVPVRGGAKPAKDIWEYDRKRIDWITSKGYSVMVVWETDYNTNKESITQDCINFINKYYERT